MHLCDPVSGKVLPKIHIQTGSKVAITSISRFSSRLEPCSRSGDAALAVGGGDAALAVGDAALPAGRGDAAWDDPFAGGVLDSPEPFNDPSDDSGETALGGKGGISWFRSS